MSKKSNWLLKNTAIFAIGNIMTKAVQFFLMPLYTALLTTSEYGISELFNNTVELIMPIVTLSITEAVFRFSMDRDAKRTHLFSAGIAFTLFGIIITALFCLIANGFLGKYYPIWLFLPLLASHSIRLLFAQYVRALEKVKEYAASGVLNSISLVIFASIFLSLLDMGIEGYILSIIASNTVSLLFLLFFVNIREIVIDFKIDCQLMGEMIRYSAPLVPNTISWWLTNTSSRYIVIAICGASIGGLFSAASKIPALMNVFVNTFQQAWVMSAIKEYEGNRDIGFQSRVFKMYSQFLY